jgi:peptidoglycan/LPS O-acetylase OafA/YrhL
METKRAPRWWALLVLAALFLGPMVLKAVQEGWFAPSPPLELNSQPALVFFTLSRGCECQMTVVQSAEAQLAAWELPADLGLNVIRVDINRRPDLARQYGVARASALVLLDSQGQVVWKQDVGLSDEAPLDLNQIERQLETLTKNP